MKKIIIFGLLLIIMNLATSCKKENFENYIEVNEDSTNLTNWETEYSNNGTLPTLKTVSTNKLVGTTWILPQYRAGSFTLIDLTPPDTLEFIDETNYTYNGFNYTYDLYQSGNVYKLDLYQTIRFGYINASLPINIFDVGELFLHRFYTQDIGSSNELFYYITLIEI